MSARIEWHGDFAKAAVRAAAGQGLGQAAEMVKSASNAMVPEESGYLGKHSGTDVDAQGLEATIYYDPPGAPKGGKKVYAIVRHEALRQGGQPKYLERPLIANRHEAARIIAAAIQRALS